MTNYEKNLKFAIDFEKRVMHELLNHTNDSIQKEFIQTLFEKYLSVTPRQNENRFVTLNISSPHRKEINGASRKLSNITLDLKNMIITALEFALGIDTPNAKIDFIKLAFFAVLKLYVLSAVQLENSECLLLLYLHQNNAYHEPIHEKSVLKAIDRGQLNLTKDEYYVAINKLLRISTVNIIGEEILLIEKIVLKY